MDNRITIHNSRCNVERKGYCGDLTRDIIARRYLELMTQFYSEDRRLYLSMDRGDMFHTAIALILQDDKFQRYKSEDVILKEIKRRISNVIREIIQDSREPNTEEENADYLQAEEQAQ